MSIIYFIINVVFLINCVYNIAKSGKLLNLAYNKKLNAEIFYRVYGILFLTIIGYINYIFLNVDFFWNNTIKFDDVLYNINELVISCVIIIGLEMLEIYILEKK